MGFLSRAKPDSRSRVGGMVLCGGHSRRMGYPKADLPFGHQSLLARIVDIVSQVTSPVVVVAAAGQPLPPLPADVTVTHDLRESRGPLEGIAAGMLALRGRPEFGQRDSVDAVYVTSCDVPLLNTPFIRHMIDQLGEKDSIAVPRCERFHHPLAAVYRMNVLPTMQRLLADDLLRPIYLFDQLRTHKVAVDTLRDVDPELSALENVNTPDQYFSALERCGLEPSPEMIEHFHSSQLDGSRVGRAADDAVSLPHRR